MIALAIRGMRFHWRSYMGLLLGATVATSILVGALAVGDSVRQSLKAMALLRLGSIHLALHGQSHFFRAELADRVAEDLGVPVTAVLILRGTAWRSSDQGEVQSGQIQIVGVSDGFWQAASSEPHASLRLPPGSCGVNKALAHRMGVKVGEELVLRIEKPSALSRDAPLSSVEDSSVPLRVRVSAEIPDARGGRFSLTANQLPPLTVFVRLDDLQKTVGKQKRANAFLVSKPDTTGAASIADRPSPEAAAKSLWKHWQFTDGGLELHSAAAGRQVELRSDRVFLDPPVGETAAQAIPGSEGVFAYFVNELRVGDRTTPYSVVAGMQGGPIPDDMQDNEALVNRWLAEDLRARVGDRVKLTYWVVGPMRKLISQSHDFRIRAILPLEGRAADRDLMPNIPGLSDKENCRDWEPGVPIDLDKIRDKDQAYWSKHRGTPKAFLTLRSAQSIWNNRFGNLTAVRYSARDDAPSKDMEALSTDPATSIENRIRQALSPSSLGIQFAPVREQAMKATSTALDFGQLFLAFSFFLIVAALLLTALLFGFAVEQRAEEVGTLLAMGFRRGSVRRLLILEAIGPMIVAAGAGSAIGTLYTSGIIMALNTVWRGAVAGASLSYSAEPRTVIMGAFAGFATALCTVWIVTRRQARAPIRTLLSSGAETHSRPLAFARRQWLPGTAIAFGALTMGLVMALLAIGKDQQSAAMNFFGAGMAFLIAGIAGCRAILTKTERRASISVLTLRTLAYRTAARRPGRSIAAIALLASGTFLVIAVGASRQDPGATADRRDSGTGGFRFYAESTLPVYEDLNSRDGREANNLDHEVLGSTLIVPMRLRDADEASCLNLNRVQTPRVLGVQPSQLTGRFAFSAVSAVGSPGNAWSVLDSNPSDGSIPAVGDMNTIVWSLGKSLGDTIDYVDERGSSRKLRIVGILSGSILQGGLIIHERAFERMFPSQNGYQVFLIDAMKRNATTVRQELVRGLDFQGVDILDCTARLAAFHSVEETYLSIFAALGGLGLLLGSAGLGVIVLRNVLERRGELAVMLAIGFQRKDLKSLVFSEHAILLLSGLGIGTGAAVAAVLPTIRTIGTAPVTPILMSLLLVLASGLIWTWLATIAALRGSLMQALRNE